MRKSINLFVKMVSETLPIIQPIYEFGSYQVKGQEAISNLRGYFSGMVYFGCDFRNGPGVDQLLNLHNIELPDNSVGTVLALDTFEHVEFPHIAIKEIYRVLKPNGFVVISSVMNFPIHDFPHDYWRFTPDGLKSLLGDFSSIWVGFSGDPNFPHTVIGIGFKDIETDLGDFHYKYNKWKKYPYFKGIISQFIPPILARLYRSLRK